MSDTTRILYPEVRSTKQVAELRRALREQGMTPDIKMMQETQPWGKGTRKVNIGAIVRFKTEADAALAKLLHDCL